MSLIYLNVSWTAQIKVGRRMDLQGYCIETDPIQNSMCETLLRRIELSILY